MVATVEPVTLILLLLAYLLGAIPFGYIIVKVREGRDVRTAGSGNIGATNVGRVAGKAAGVLTLLLDLAKGFAAVWLMGRFTNQDVASMVAAALAVVLGHMFPVWLKFKGGKGVATGVGAFIPICWQAVIGAMVVWIIVVVIWRYVSLGSIIAAASLPLLTYGLYAARPEEPPTAVTVGTVLISALIIVKHKDNIARLVAGTENRLGSKGTA